MEAHKQTQHDKQKWDMDWSPSKVNVEADECSFSALNWLRNAVSSLKVMWYLDLVLPPHPPSPSTLPALGVAFPKLRANGSCLWICGLGVSTFTVQLFTGIGQQEFCLTFNCYRHLIGFLSIQKWMVLWLTIEVLYRSNIVCGMLKCSQNYYLCS